MKTRKGITSLCGLHIFFSSVSNTPLTVCSTQPLLMRSRTLRYYSQSIACAALHARTFPLQCLKAIPASAGQCFVDISFKNLSQCFGILYSFSQSNKNAMLHPRTRYTSCRTPLDAVLFLLPYSCSQLRVLPAPRRGSMMLSMHHDDDMRLASS